MKEQVEDFRKWFHPLETVPSITRQTGWPCGIFNFGKALMPDVDYFNCSLVARPDGDWLITRRAFWKNGMRFGQNDLMAFLLNGKNPVKGVKVKIPGREHEHFEDPRAIFHNGQTWIGACNFIVFGGGQTWTGAHQILTVADGNWVARVRYDPVYGKNGPNLDSQRGDEKNWLWFFHEGRMHMIYLSQPHTVIEFDDNLQKVREYVTETPNLQWSHGMIRGGTPPVRVGDEYWSFFHSSTPWIHSKRRYHMGAYCFEAKPPFAIQRVTPMPLLTGSQQDYWAPGKPLVVFPCGSILRNGVWTVVGGCNDIQSFWIDIPHEQVLGKTVDATRKSVLQTVASMI